MKLSSWGMFPRVNGLVQKMKGISQLRRYIEEDEAFIPVGNLRSYGDSALCKKMLDCTSNNFCIAFDDNSGVLHCQSGVLLSDIIESFLPRGWFLSITPGTKLITVGGAIASDVHGKNHHVAGCFSECVKELTIMTAQGDIETCRHGDELFHATCGGMGLTGVILDAKIQLKKVNSAYINQTTIKTSCLDETFAAFEKYKDYPYSVAWIDCLAKGEALGRSLLMLGDFANDGDLEYKKKNKINIPFRFPSWALNSFSVRVFNWLYYTRVGNTKSKKKVSIDTFFYPLDAIENWNRIYGRNGFTQYQCIFPKNVSNEGLRKLLYTIAESGKGSFLAVLKLYGPQNANYLSFPIQGYSLALDFKIERDLFHLLNKLDKIVLEFGGRLYLAKDVRVSKETFEQGYTQIDAFRGFRKKHGMDKKFQSLQSKRVDI